MTTVKHELTDEAWTDLGPAPCLVQSTAGVFADRSKTCSGPASIALAISDAEPALDAASHAVSGQPFSITLAGRVWARAENGFGALVIVSR